MNLILPMRQCKVKNSKDKQRAASNDWGGAIFPVKLWKHALQMASDAINARERAES